jgi:hypothetical protein
MFDGTHVDVAVRLPQSNRIGHADIPGASRPVPEDDVAPAPELPYPKARETACAQRFSRTQSMFDFTVVISLSTSSNLIIGRR